MEIISGDVAIEVTCTAVREKHGKEPDRFDRDKLYLQLHPRHVMMELFCNAM